MTLNDLLENLNRFQFYIGGVLLFFVFLTHIIIALKSENRTSSFSLYLLSIILYSVSVPGIFFALLLFYHMLFLQHSLLDLNILVFFFPIAIMLYTFYIIARKTKISSLPGFEKYKSVLIVIAIVLLVLFFLVRIHFVVGFFGSITSLVVIGIALFVILKKAFKKLQ